MSINLLHKRLIKTKTTISIAESCTGGLLSSKLTKLSGSSKYFKMGLITYSNYAKINILKVNKKIIDRYGAVSQECCKSMVENLSKLSKSKINISITGVAGPKGGTKVKPVGLVFIGIKRGNKILIIKNLFGKKKRSIVQNNTVKKCINLLIKII
tara:strand:+ start:1493 stop:1957 length:465 start_codon:yes stop_codon:yes gene_type:complete